MKMKYIFYLVTGLLLGSTTSCDDWLNIEQDTEKKAENMYDNYSGFQGALAGCYFDLAKTDLYGMRLSMADTEALAGLWYIDISKSANRIMDADYYLTQHDYNHAYSVEAIKKIYGGLYNAILEANNVLKGCKKHGHNVPFPKSRAVIEGEAYAFRAFCHLDVLRLFGQMPKNATIKVSLPYSETTSLEEVPAYYTYEDFVKKLEADFENALLLMKDNDPAYADYSYKQLWADKGNKEAVSLEDDFMMNRRYRLNYWAVKALQARMYMYIGNTEKAHDLAMEVIQAKLSDGRSVVTLSSDKDYGTTGTDFVSSSECLFMLYMNDLYSISVPLLAGGETEVGSDYYMQVDLKDNLVVHKDWFPELFPNVNTATDIRYKRMWSRTITSQKFEYPTIRKYYIYKSNDASSGKGFIPIVRLSEMYLIAIETAGTLTEATQLYTDYMLSKGVVVHDAFTSMEDMKKVLEAEFRIEFFAEGQMFFYYKRNNVTTLWSKPNASMSENDYILPLPSTEFNPNK